MCTRVKRTRGVQVCRCRQDDLISAVCTLLWPVLVLIRARRGLPVSFVLIRTLPGALSSLSLLVTDTLQYLIFCSLLYIIANIKIKFFGWIRTFIRCIVGNFRFFGINPCQAFCACTCNFTLFSLIFACTCLCYYASLHQLASCSSIVFFFSAEANCERRVY